MTAKMWNDVASHLAAKGFHKTGPQCLYKWQNLRCGYNATRRLRRLSGAGGPHEEDASAPTDGRRLSTTLFELLDKEFASSASAEPPMTMGVTNSDLIVHRRLQPEAACVSSASAPSVTAVTSASDATPSAASSEGHDDVSPQRMRMKRRHRLSPAKKDVLERLDDVSRDLKVWADSLKADREKDIARDAMLETMEERILSLLEQQIAGPSVHPPLSTGHT
jgi:hypothetical protein